MDKLLFEEIKKELLSDKNRWQASIGIFDNIIERSQELREINEIKGKSFRVGVFHQIVQYLKIDELIEHKKINNLVFLKATKKLEEAK